ncbi:S8 family serine peptidase [Halococcus qingdaonensis]|uniref:S8 family serine peptidase n=1 Tax=Halococcus qingdaonensis TaxID=224402 RepID=UPI0021165111|nr:S8 family serine peptidase [Halococcus qingdaonensis]
MDDDLSFDRRRFLKTAGFFGLLGGASTIKATALPSNGKQNELLIGINPTANSARTAKRALPTGARIISQNTTLGYVRAELPEQASVASKSRTTSRVASRPGVEYAEPNVIYEAALVPNDPRFGDQYASKTVNAPDAWDTTLGDADVTIAVVDQGVKYDHPDLEDNIASNVGRDFVNNSGDPYPEVLADEHHGTHVAGIAAAGTDNATGIAGVSNATLLSVRALNETGSGYSSDIADGIQWAADNGADIINLSLSGSGNSATLQKAVTYAHEKGVLLVAAAGNDYRGPVSYPAAYDECIAVSALDPDGSLASYSNTGSQVELAAPGTNLLSTWTDNDYATLSGTSMATPVVAGISALVLSQRDYSTGQLRTYLKDNAVDSGLASNEQGAGRADVGGLSHSSENIISIDGSGRHTDYSITVSGDLAKSTANGGTIGSSSEISGSTATGYVWGGTDSYAFSGEIINLDIGTGADVFINGERTDPNQYAGNILSIEGQDSRADYTFSISGKITKSTANGGTIGSSSDVSGSTATGYVWGGTDSYAFSGDIESFNLDGKANVTLNNEPAHVGRRPDHIFSIEGQGSRADYTLSVTEDLSKSTANNGTIGSSSEVSGSTATGYVWGGTDSYAFSGKIASLSLDGDASIYLDGQKINPTQFSDNILSIEGQDSRADYTFSVSGKLTKSTANDGTIGSSTKVLESTATGYVWGGTDSYAFSGNIESFNLGGDAEVFLNGKRIDPAEYLDNILSIEGHGSRADYTFSVSGDLAKSTANGGTTGSSSEISGSTATGYVWGGTDSYAFSGELRKINIDNDSTIHLNGEELNTESPSVAIYSGLSDADFSTVDQMETWQNTGYDVQNLFVPWNPNKGHMNWLFDHILPRIWNAGRTPLITWEPYTPGARTASVDTQSLVEQNEYDTYIESLADTTPNNIEVRIGNGDYDRYIDRWAGRLRDSLSKSSGRRAYLRLAHEMNGDWYPWSPTVGNSSPRSYVKMWRHVHNRFDRQGIGDDLQWMWCVNAEDVGSHSAEQLFPGNRYVDWLGLDGYNWGRSKSWSSWDSPESIYGGMLDRLSGLSNKPVCVAEFASSSKVNGGHDPRRKGEWIRDALAYFENRGVDMWCWFNEDKETDWAVFNGERGTERLSHNGRQVNAYSAYREAIDTYATIGGAATAEANAAEQAVSDD